MTTNIRETIAAYLKNTPPDERGHTLRTFVGMWEGGEATLDDFEASEQALAEHVAYFRGQLDAAAGRPRMASPTSAYLEGYGGSPADSGPAHTLDALEAELKRHITQLLAIKCSDFEASHLIYDAIQNAARIGQASRNDAETDQPLVRRRGVVPAA